MSSRRSFSEATVKIISHRGNLNGPNPLENHPGFIDDAIAAGFDVEIDLRYIDHQFWLGHNKPQYFTSLLWLLDRKDKLWIHCKDLESCSKISGTFLRYFCHSQDPFVLINNSAIWVHDLSLRISDQCVIPLITKEQLSQRHLYKPYGICTDYPNELRRYT